MPQPNWQVPTMRRAPFSTWLAAGSASVGFLILGQSKGDVLAQFFVRILTHQAPQGFVSSPSPDRAHPERSLLAQLQRP
jgi:hypothetical protein